MVSEDLMRADDVGSSSFSPEDFRTSVLRSIVAQQCINVGWHSITESSLAAMTDVLHRYLRQLSRKIAGYTHLAGRTVATVEDFRLALTDLEPSNTLKNLSNFCSSINDSLPPINVNVPPRAVSDLEKNARVTSDGIHEENGAVEHIPNGSSMFNESGDRRRSVVGEADGRPDWMDQDLIFPPLDTVPSLKDTLKIVFKEDDQRPPPVLADIIIADEDEDIMEISKPPVASQIPASPMKTSPSKVAVTPTNSWPRQMKSVSVINGELMYPQNYAVPAARVLVHIPKKPDGVQDVVPVKRKKDAGKKDRAPLFVEGPTSRKKQRTKVPMAMDMKPTISEVPRDDLKIRIKQPKLKASAVEVPRTSIKSEVSEVDSAQQIPSHPKSDSIPSTPASPPPFTPPDASQKKVTLKLRASLPVLVNKKDKRTDERQSNLDVVDANMRDRKAEKSGKRKRDFEETPTVVERTMQKISTHEADYLAHEKQRKRHTDQLPYEQMVVAPFTAAPSFDDLPIKKSKKEHRHDKHRDRDRDREKETERLRKQQESEEEAERLRQREERHREKQRIKTAMSAPMEKAVKHERQWDYGMGQGEQAREKSKPKDAYTSDFGVSSRPTSGSDRSSHSTAPAHPPLPKLKLKMGGKDIKVITPRQPTTVSMPPTPPAHPHYPPQPLFDQMAVMPQPLTLPEQLSFNPPVYPSMPAAPLDLSMKTPSKTASSPSTSYHQLTSSSSIKTSSKSSKHSSSHSTVQRPPSPPQSVYASYPSGSSKGKKHDRHAAAATSQPPREPTPPPQPAPVEYAPVVAEEVAYQEHEVGGGDGKIWICPACSRLDDGSPMVGCDGCDEWFHWPCVGLLAEPTLEKWYCPNCLNKRVSKKGKGKKGR